MLNTESPSDAHRDLDLYDAAGLVHALVEDQEAALAAVRHAIAELTTAVEAAAPHIEAGGRLLYVGAGTSGRLGLLDNVELHPTFSWPKSRARALVAGGRAAVFESIEGAEDHPEHGERDLLALQPGPNDVVILLSASGTTPYVLGALQAARRVGALTIAIANNPGAPLTRDAQVGITLDTGSEIISGSTRLKAGTAQKIALNTFSSAIMVRLNKVYRNLMVDLHPTNAKLHERAVQLTVRASGADEPAARAALHACGHRVKAAIVMLRLNVPVPVAEARLRDAGGNLRVALGEAAAGRAAQP